MLWDIRVFTALWVLWSLTFLVQDLCAIKVEFFQSTFWALTLCVAAFFCNLAMFIAAPSWFTKIFVQDLILDFRATTYLADAVFPKISSSQLDQGNLTRAHLFSNFFAAKNRKLKGRPALSPHTPTGPESS